MIYSILEDKAAINKDLEDGIKAGYKVVGKKLKDIAGDYLENKIGINLISWADEIRGKKRVPYMNLIRCLILIRL